MNITDNWYQESQAALRRRKRNTTTEKMNFIKALHEIAQDMYDYKILDDRTMLLLNHYVKSRT